MLLFLFYLFLTFLFSFFKFIQDGGHVFVWGRDIMKGERNPIQTPTIVEKFQALNIFIDQITCGSDCILSVVGLKNFEKLKFKSFDPIVVHSGTVDALIDWLVHPRRFTMIFTVDEYLEHFLISYPTFCTPQELFTLLSKKLMECDMNKNVYQFKKILKTFQEWLKMRENGLPSEFDEPNFSSIVLNFFLKLKPKHMAAQKMIKLLETRYPRPEIPHDKDVPVNLEEIMNLGPQCFAEQLTSKENYIFHFFSSSFYFFF